MLRGNSIGGGYSLDGTSGQTAAGGPLESIPLFSVFAGFRTSDSGGFSISGQVTYNGAGLSDVNVTLDRDGATIVTTKTDANGSYSFSKLEGGHNYNVTPSKESYTFAPLNATVLNLNANTTANFSVASRNFSIKGKVTIADAPMGGVTVVLKSQNGTVINSVATDVSGQYSFAVSEGASYVVEPQKAGYNFTPQNYVYQNLSADKTADFVAAPVTFSIGGQVTEDGKSLSDVLMTLTASGGQSLMAKTDGNGLYSFSSLAGDTDYTLTPSKLNYTFNPPGLTVTKPDGNQTANFTGAKLPPPAPLVQFSAPSYGVTESGPDAIVTVTRNGDTSGTASVNYATSDNAGLQNCDVFNGIASSRCDYPTTIGILRFAAGETSKTIFIPIVDDSYAEGSETFQITLSNPQGATLGSNATAAITIIDNETVTGANPLGSVSFFVRQHYIDFLGREPDPPGFNGWQSILSNCGITVAQPCDRIEVSSDFFRSAEFQERGYFIYRFFKTLPSVTDPNNPQNGHVPRYSEFMPEFARVSGFLTADQLEAEKVAFINDFMARSEFQSTYGALTDPASYVTALLNTLGLPDHPNKNTWIAELNQGKTRAQVLREIVEDTQIYQKYYNEAFVIMQYFGYLRRDADASYVNWIQTMNSGGDYRVMINGFLNSVEYCQRFGP